MAYRIYVRLKSGETAISRKLYEGWPPSYGTVLKVPLTGADSVEVRIGTPRTEGSENVGEINADEI
jgi:hypothetical protein